MNRSDRRIVVLVEAAEVRARVHEAIVNASPAQLAEWITGHHHSADGGRGLQEFYCPLCQDTRAAYFAHAGAAWTDDGLTWSCSVCLERSTVFQLQELALNTAEAVDRITVWLAGAAA